MSREYGKIIVGEPIDENAAFLATSTIAPPGLSHQHSGDLESASAVPIYEDQFYSRPPPPHATIPGVYGTYNHGQTPLPLVYHDENEDCAKIGCFFSFIPVVGFITCFLHADAPPMSRREFWAQRACVIATIVSIALIVFWVSWEETDDDGCVRKARVGC